MTDQTNDQPTRIVTESAPSTKPSSAPSSAPNATALLQQGSQRLGIPLTDEQLDQFARYHETLVDWNQRMNLTSIIEWEEVQTKHFLDSLVGLPLLAEEMGLSLPLSESLSGSPLGPLHLADVGTGAGFPGVPLKIAAPSLRLTLIDGTGKKVQFLSHLRDKLGLKQVDVVQGRAEELGRQATHREQFDVAVARAVAPLNTLLEYLLPLVKVGGWAMIYKGARAAEEFVEARRAIDELGGETTRFAPVEVPFLEGQRFVLLIKKVGETPERYPRGQGLARKEPL